MFRRCIRHLLGKLFLEHALLVSLHCTVIGTLHLGFFLLQFLLVVRLVLLQCSFRCFAWVVVMLIIVVPPFIIVLSLQFFRIVVCWQLGGDVKG
jgi:hypothetical protein